MTTLQQLFSFVCGQAHVWTVGGQTLPLCQRCTGLYLGAACALIAWVLFRPKPTNAILWAHGIALLAMIPFGYHLVPQNGDVRTMTGYVFAFGLTYYLMLLPGAQEKVSGDVRGGATAYVLFALAGAAALLVGVHYGTSRTASFLAWSSVAGLSSLALLSLFNLGLVLRRLSGLRPGWMGPEQG